MAVWWLLRAADPNGVCPCHELTARSVAFLLPSLTSKRDTAYRNFHLRLFGRMGIFNKCATPGSPKRNVMNSASASAFAAHAVKRWAPVSENVVRDTPASSSACTVSRF